MTITEEQARAQLAYVWSPDTVRLTTHSIQGLSAATQPIAQDYYKMVTQSMLMGLNIMPPGVVNDDTLNIMLAHFARAGQWTALYFCCCFGFLPAAAHSSCAPLPPVAYALLCVRR